MKKIIALALTVVVATSLFAAGLTFPEQAVTDVRSNGMGGAHLADYTDYFTLYRNPSLLQKAGKHWYWDTLTLNLGAPLQYIPELVDTLPSMMDDPQALLNSPVVSDLLANGLNVNAAVNFPMLSFGAITGHNTGWGLYNRILVDANIPSLMGKTSAAGGGELGVIYGYGQTIPLTDVHTVSVGGSLRTYFQAKAGIKAPLTSLMSNASSALEGISRIGTGLDMAATYTYDNWLDAALVWHNMIAPTWVGASNGDDLSGLTSFAYSKKWAEPKLGIGVGADVPTWWAMGIISNWRAYADHYNVINMFKKGLRRNPWLDLSLGTEVSIMRILDLRLGFYEGYLNTGIGMNLGAISWDFAMYGKELSTQPGGTPQLNATFSMSFQR